MSALLNRKAATHRVTPRDGFYEVVSGMSGRTYRVAPTGGEGAVCDCAARVRSCSHVVAVIEFARRLLSNQPTNSSSQAPTGVKPPQSPIPAAPPSAGGDAVARLFDRIERGEKARRDVGIS